MSLCEFQEAWTQYHLRSLRIRRRILASAYELRQRFLWPCSSRPRPCFFAPWDLSSVGLRELRLNCNQNRMKLEECALEKIHLQECREWAYQRKCGDHQYQDLPNPKYEFHQWQRWFMAHMANRSRSQQRDQRGFYWGTIHVGRPARSDCKWNRLYQQLVCRWMVTSPWDTSWKIRRREFHCSLVSELNTSIFQLE